MLKMKILIMLRIFIIYLLFLSPILLKAQDLSNCTTQIIDLYEDASAGFAGVYEGGDNVEINFESNCGCGLNTDCKLIQINIPNNAICQGLVISQGSSISAQDLYLSPTENKDFFDVYYLNNCTYLGTDDYTYSRTRNVYSPVFGPQTGGTFEFLLCKGDHLLDNSVYVSFHTSDYCQEVAQEDCCPTSTTEVINESNKGYGSFDFGSLQFSNSCTNTYVQLVKGTDGTIHGDGAVLPFPCGQHELIIEINSNGNVFDCPFTLKVQCDAPCEGCLDYIPGTGQYLNEHGPLSLTSRGLINKYGDTYLKDGDQYVGSSFTNFDNLDVKIFKNNQEQITISGDKDEAVSEIFKDPSGNLYITGSFASPILSVSGSINLNNFNNNGSTYDGFVSKFDHSNNLIWAFSFGASFQDVPEDFYQIDEDEFVVVGKTFNHSDFDGDSNRIKMTCNGGEVKGFIAKYTELGNGIPRCDWVRSFEIEGKGNISGAYGVTVMSSKIYVVGNYKSATDSSISVKDENCNVTGNSLTVSTNFEGGIMASFDMKGSCLDLKKTGVPNSDKKHFLDIENDGTHLYAVGLDCIGKYNANNAEMMTEVLYKEMPSHYLVELDLTDNEIIAVGWTGVQSILAKYDLNTLDELCIMHPGQYAYTRGASIHASDGKVAVAASSSHVKFETNHPVSTSFLGPLSNPSPLNFFSGLYTVCGIK